MIFEKIISEDGTGTLSYIIADERTLNGLIIDPNFEDTNLIADRIKSTGIHLKYVIDTHTHADHISAAGELKKLFGSKLIMHENTKNKWKVVDQGDAFGIGDILRANAALKVDRYVSDKDELAVDSLKFRFLFTPGHTDNHISVLIEDKLFTGDLLLIGQAGRSDLPGGNPGEQYDSFFNKIMKLPGDIKIYPGHDYEDNHYNILADEIKSNPFLQQRTKEEYLKFVKDFFSPITETTENGKTTLQCGTKRIVSEKNETFSYITAAQLADMISSGEDLFLLDVREPFELMAFGAVPGVVNIRMGELARRINEIPKDKGIVVICQSGNRSYEAAHYLSSHGFSSVYNLDGGISAWMYSGAEKKVRYHKVI